MVLLRVMVMLVVEVLVVVVVILVVLVVCVVVTFVVMVAYAVSFVILVKISKIHAYCRSPDFKSPIGPTKNLERHYNRVVVCSVGRSVGWLQRWL